MPVMNAVNPSMGLDSGSNAKDGVNADFAGAKIYAAPDIPAKHTPHPFLSSNWGLLEFRGSLA